MRRKKVTKKTEMFVFKYLFIYLIFMLLNIVSWNARGLLNMEKFEKMGELCKEADVILLQETNWKNESVKRLQTKWDGNIHFNNGDEKAGRGVAILIKRGICEKEKVIFDDKMGKSMAVKIEKGEEDFIIYNIHAPNEEKEKVEFLKKVNFNLKKWQKVILIGDFNTVFTELDLASKMVFKADKGREELVKIMADFNLIDVWRERNRTKRTFSRIQRVMKEMKRSRIDYVLCNGDIEGSIKNVFYKEVCFSDHSFLNVKLDSTRVDRGAGVWVLNADILKDEFYKERIKQILETSQMNGMYLEEKRIWWDNVKLDIKNFSIQYCKSLRKAKKSKEMEIRIELEKETKRIEENQKEGDLAKMLMLQDQLRVMEDERCIGAIIRSKAKYVVEGERSTKFFFNLEKNRQRADLMKEVLDKNGEIKRGTEEILTTVKDFYKDLFERQGIDKEEEGFFLNQIKLKVSVEDKFICDAEIMEEEIDNAIRQLTIGKSPGIDGLTNEFYKNFRGKIVPILKEVYDEIFKKEELSERMKIGMIKMIYKKRGNPSDLKNHRPLTMLNTDFKVLAKVLANRLRKVLPKIISTTQTYGVQGKDILDIVQSIRDTMFYMKEKNRNGYLISLDLEKAFDRVEHEYLFNVLKGFGFGGNFRKWIKIFYSNILTCIKCNGFLSECFQPTRSIRQGCPLSALLYSLVAEPLGLAMKADGEIKGIRIEENTKHEPIYQYADDTTLLVEDVQSVMRAMGILEKYCKGSGAKVNVDKSVYMRVGSVEPLHQHIHFKEEEEGNIKILGIWVGLDFNKADVLNWEGALKGIEKRLRFWKLRNLTLKGKVLVINALMLSKIWYVLSVTPLPHRYFKRIKESVLDFLWGKGRVKIAYDTLIGGTEEGGLGLLDPFLRMKTLRIKLVKSFLDIKRKVMWKNVLEYFLRKCGYFNMECNVLWMKTKKDMLTGIPTFYEEVLEAWGKFLDNLLILPKGRTQLLEQPLFLNPNITKDGNVIYYKKWWDGGLRQVKDVLYEVIKGYLPIQAIVDTVSEIEGNVGKGTLVKQFDELKKAIPKEWVEMIDKNEETEKRDMPELYFKKKNGENVPFMVCKVKDFYFVFREMAFKKPVANNYWKERYDDLNENEIWRKVGMKYMEPIVENFNFLLRHNCILTEMRLCKIGLERNATCKVCMKNEEGLIHLFFYCENLREFMEKIKNIAKSLLKEKYDEDMIQKKWEKMFLFGINGKDYNVTVFNFLVTIAKHATWLRRNIAKYEKRKVNVWSLFKNKMETTVKLLCEYFLMNDKKDDFIEIFLEGNPMIEYKMDGVTWLWEKYE